MRGPALGVAGHGALHSTRRHWGCATRVRQCHPQWNKSTRMTFWLRPTESFHTVKRHSKRWLGLWPHSHPSCTWCFAALSRCSVALYQAAGTSPTSICLRWEAEPELEQTTVLSIRSCLPKQLNSHSHRWEISTTFNEWLTTFIWQFMLARDCSMAMSHSWNCIRPWIYLHLQGVGQLEEPPGCHRSGSVRSPKLSDNPLTKYLDKEVKP